MSQQTDSQSPAPPPNPPRRRASRNNLSLCEILEEVASGVVDLQ